MANRNRFIAVLPVAIATAAVGAILSEPLPVPAEYLGPVTGEAERDTYGQDLTGRAPAAALPRYSRAPQQLGAATGDPEKDTFGLVVLRGSTDSYAAAE